jgi:probable rRNA maturation factor
LERHERAKGCMILNRQRRYSLSLTELEKFAECLARHLSLSAEQFSVVLVSDRRMAALNRFFRGRSHATDVLSFPAGNGTRGDIVISVESARRQARRYQHSLAEEIQLLMIHGLLHLVGYDHERDRGEMVRREHALRRRMGLE